MKWIEQNGESLKTRLYFKSWNHENYVGVIANSWYLYTYKGGAGAGAETAPAPGFLQRAGAETAPRILVAAPQPWIFNLCRIIISYFIRRYVNNLI